MAEHAPTLACHVHTHVNCLLHVAARLREHLAHLPLMSRSARPRRARHPREAEQDRASSGSRHETPVGKRRFRGVHRAIDVICAGTWKRPERRPVGGDVDVSPTPCSTQVADEVLNARRCVAAMHASVRARYAAAMLLPRWACPADTLLEGVIRAADVGEPRQRLR